LATAVEMHRIIKEKCPSEVTSVIMQAQPAGLTMTLSSYLFTILYLALQDNLQLLVDRAENMELWL
jgi:hypothetical protein